MTETVLYAPNDSCSDVYHLPENGGPVCRMARRAGREWREIPRPEVEKFRRLCKTCRDGRVSGDEASELQKEKLGVECPFCGETTPRLPPHLPCDGSAGAAEVVDDA